MTYGKHTGLTRECALEVLHGCGFHFYHAKSWNESLFIHSFSTYALVDGVVQFTQAYSESDKELMRWAALLHDYEKTSANWQKALRGPHKVTLEDVKYAELEAILESGIQKYSRALLTSADIDDILFIIEHHHGSGMMCRSFLCLTLPHIHYRPCWTQGGRTRRLRALQEEGTARRVPRVPSVCAGKCHGSGVSTELASRWNGRGLLQPTCV